MSIASQFLTPKLAKLTLSAYSDAQFKNAITKNGLMQKNYLSLPYNPSSLYTNYGSLYSVKNTIVQENENSENESKYEGNQPHTLSLSLQLDSTLPENQDLDIAETITILETFGYAIISGTGEPPYLKVSWGNTEWSGGKEEFHCRMSNMSVSYTLFDTDGKPLRANVNLSFIEKRPIRDYKERAEALSLPTVNISIPDLSVLPTVIALLATGAAMANETIDYVNAGFENDLDNLHALIPGETLILGSETTNPR
ncbi:hypothetical protein ID852_03610 [Xenorhabdus sp. 42]|uniref:CIS tube protein n=1 Tax=Xenorhabdus szentirmaii TaxID=290112 RepID=UPI0019A0EFDA|nr:MULTISPECIES: hypothetical protein [unclassified Xenorhabdus]MBD2794006.1 hypothetical protein [Xenorhabdus sp. CUL]MBD2803834.1 hypothetical protein [Xenorhabdus sp. ZM]MBD2819792.1 hypothetical protein [Xenorhabdus sp. 42]MBD2826596.1 hypothetical protein [Xenorhabdus sp. 5]